MARLPHQRPKNATEILQGLTDIYRQLYPNHHKSPNPGGSLRSVSPPPLPPIKLIAAPTQPLTATESGFNQPPDLASPPPGQGKFPNFSPPSPELYRPPSPARPDSSSPFPSTSQGTNTPLQPEFIALCQQELAEFVGPMASIICQRVRKQGNFSPQEFIEQ
jgi:hypothetical protein